MTDQQPPREPISDDGDEIDLRAVLGTLWDGKWIIAGLMIAGSAIGFVYAGTQPPSYTAEAVIYVEGNDSTNFWQSAMAGPGNNRAGGSLAMERAIITSRSLAREVASQDGYDLVIQPQRVPVLGPFIANRYQGDKPNTPPFTIPDLSWIRSATAGLIDGIDLDDGYAWGGEDLRIDRLDTEGDLFGANFTLEAGTDGAYQLYAGPPADLTEASQPILQGRVDETARAGDDLSMFVSTLHAQPGTLFHVRKLSPTATMNSLRNTLTVTAQEDSSMLRLQMTGGDARDVDAKLQSFVDRHMRRNIERRTAEAEQQMTFLEEQLPEQRRELEAAEQRYNEFRRDAESIDLRAEDQRLVSEMIELESELLTIEIEREQLRERLQPNHPQLRQLAEREQRLTDRRQELEGRLSNLPESQQELIRLEREVGINSTLYSQMMNSMQEVRLTRAGLVPTISIVDPVYVGPPQGIGAARTTGIGGALGAMLAFGLVFGQSFFRRNVEDIDQVEQATGLSVFSVLLHSREQTRLNRRPIRGDYGPNLLAAQYPHSLVTEAFRSLRTSLHFALLNNRRHVLSFTSPEPNAGKSFTTANLAWAAAKAGKRTLLIDADMRRGGLDDMFDMDPSPGLSDLLAGTTPTEFAVRQTHLDRLHLLPAGTRPPNPSELLMAPMFDDLLAWAESHYDLVIIDSPPILPVSDAVIIGARCGANLMVVRAHQTTIPMVQHAIRQLTQNRLSVAGLIINGMKPRKTSSKYQQYYGNARYYGQYAATPAATKTAEFEWDRRPHTPETAFDFTGPGPGPDPGPDTGTEDTRAETTGNIKRPRRWTA